MNWLWFLGWAEDKKSSGALTPARVSPILLRYDRLRPIGQPLPLGGVLAVFRSAMPVSADA